jgi:hypothetical protein
VLARQRHVLRRRAFGSAFEHISVPQVDNAGAALPPDAGEGGRVRARAEHHVDDVAAALHGRPMVRRAEEHQLPQQSRPAVTAGLAVVACTASDQAAHAVADDGDLLEFHGPGRGQRLHQGCQLTAVRAYGAAGVVVEVEQGAAARPREPRARVRRASPGPLARVHAQAVHQQQQAGLGTGQRRREVRAIDHQRAAVMLQRHRDRQRVARLREVIAEHAVERGHDGFALGGGCRAVGAAVVQQRLQRPQQQVHPGAGGARGTADGSVHEARDAARGPVRSRAEGRGDALDVVVQGLDDAHHAERRVDGQARHRTQVAGVEVPGVRHRGLPAVRSWSPSESAFAGPSSHPPPVGPGKMERLGRI